MSLDIRDKQNISAGYEKQSCNTNSWSSKNQCALFDKTSAFEILSGEDGAIRNLRSRSWIWGNPSCVCLDLIEFLEVPGESRTRCRQRGGFPSLLFLLPAVLALQPPGRAQPSSSAEASVSCFPKALREIKLEWLSMHLTLPSSSPQKKKKTNHHFWLNR